MLYALSDPVSFVVLVGSFVLCASTAGYTSAAAAARAGLRGAGRPDLRRQLDPFAAVGAAVAGFGWGRSPDISSSRRSLPLAVAVLTGPVLVLGLGLLALAGFGASYGPVPGSSLLLQNGAGLPAGQEAWALGGLMAVYVGAVSLVPLPPLPGGAALFLLAPRTPGWQRARYQLVERNIGTAVLLALLLIPLGGSSAVLPAVLDQVLDPLVRLVSGG